MSNLIARNSGLPVVNFDDYEAIQQDLSGSGIKRFVVLGLLIVSGFIGGAVYWAASSNLDGAVVAPASFVVEGNRKTVEHLEGGIVREIHVKDGDLVEAGQTLVELDGTDLDVNLDVIESQLADLMVRRAYLLAQLSNTNRFEMEIAASTFGVELEPSLWQDAYLTQQRLFAAEKRTLASEARLRAQQIASFGAEISGLREQKAANQRQLDIISDELANLNTLLEKGLVTAARANTRRIEVERLEGINASLRTQESQAANQIEELKLTAAGQENERVQRYTSELVAVESELATLEPRYTGTKAQQRRLSINAPVSGRVVEMTVFTDGGVVRPGAAILDIVPADEDLVVEARVRTTDVDKLFVGQTTRVRLSGFGQSEVPEALGTIVNVSADSLEDERTGQPYFNTTIRLNETQTASIDDLEFVPGMPADVFINTGERTALAYMVQPLKDRLVRTFVE